MKRTYEKILNVEHIRKTHFKKRRLKQEIKTGNHVTTNATVQNPS